MSSQNAFHRTFIGLVVLVTVFITVAAQMAQACPPEIKVDPLTGIAVSQPDLTQALAEIEGRVAMADIR
jgi:hypothetical protein